MKKFLFSFTAVLALLAVLPPVSGARADAPAKLYECSAQWETCSEYGQIRVPVARFDQACDALYDATKADVIYDVKCSLIRADGELGPVIFEQKHCS